MVNKLKLSRITTLLNKYITLLYIGDGGGEIIWIMIGEQSIGAYNKTHKEIFFDTHVFIRNNNLNFDTEIVELLEQLIIFKLRELFKDKIIKDIKFI